MPNPAVVIDAEPVVVAAQPETTYDKWLITDIQIRANQPDGRVLIKGTFKRGRVDEEGVPSFPPDAEEKPLLVRRAFRVGDADDNLAPFLQTILDAFGDFAKEYGAIT